ncbi:MAG: hypothetical protein HOP19_02045 [Acidobacteria bacterium]|nr:hypothetical protein [Acidobacteriota bacterium]
MIKAYRFPQNLLAGLFWAFVSTTLVLLVEKGQISQGISQVLMVITGMAVVATFSSFQHFLAQLKPAHTVELSFNESLLRHSLPADNGNYLEPAKDWELTPLRLVGVDNTLALAKLRIEIEHELRRIAHQHSINVTSRLLSPGNLLQELGEKDLLPANLLIGSKDIFRVCNQAIHGAEINNETATSVVNMGNQLIEYLRTL